MMIEECYNCWKVICKSELIVILRPVLTHDLDNVAYQRGSPHGTLDPDSMRIGDADSKTTLPSHGPGSGSELRATVLWDSALVPVRQFNELARA